MRGYQQYRPPNRPATVGRKLVFERLESRYLLAATLNKSQLVFDAVLGGSASAAKTITLSNTGSAPLTLSGISITGDNTELFSTTASNTTPANIAPGASLNIDIVFDPPSSELPGPKAANLHLVTNDVDTPAFDVYLGGLATIGEDGANEPSLQWILDTFRIPVDVGDPTPSTLPIETITLPNSNNIERFVKAGPGPVNIDTLAIFSGNTLTQPAAIVGWYDSSTTLNELMQYGTGNAGQHQEMTPSVDSGSNDFDPGTASFGMYSQWPTFPGRTVYSENSLNTFDATTQKQLVYALREIDGTIVPNAYIVAIEADSNNSFQDLVYIIRNVSPLSPGDYTQDQTVDAADYVLWRKNLGQPIGLPNEEATPGGVTEDDYTIWRANVGKVAVLPGGPTSAFDEYKDIKLWASMHFGLVTYDSVGPVEIGTGTSSIDTFKPTNFLTGMEDWFDYVTKLGAQGGRFVTHYWDGFCLWPSQTSTRNVSQTQWYADNGGIDPVRVYTDLCRAYGIKVGLYYNVRDLYFDSIGGGDYTQWTVDMLTELMSNYGDIDYLFIDGWGDSWSGGGGGLSYTEVDYATVMNVIRSLQPGCVVAINDHQNSGTPHGDVRWSERPAEPEPSAGYTFYRSVMLDDTLLEDYGAGYIGRWFEHSDSPPETPADATAPIGRRFRMLRAGYGYSSNFSLDPTGSLLPSTKSMLDEMWTPVGKSVVDDNFSLNEGETGPANLETRSEWTRGFALDDSKHAVVSTSGEVWANNSGAPVGYFRNDQQLSDVRVEADFVFKSVPSTFELDVLLQSNGSSDDRVILYKSGSTFGVSLATIASGSYMPLASMGGLEGELVVGEKYRLAIQKTGNELRAELWREDSDGELIMWGKLVATSSINSSEGLAGFLLSGPGSDTTGLHLTGFRETTPDREAPPPPALSIVGDDALGYHIEISKFQDAHYTKLYRSTDGGLTYTVAALTTDDTFVDPQWVAGNTYQYRAVSLDRSWNESDYSNVVTLTLTESQENSYPAAVPEPSASGSSGLRSLANTQQPALTVSARARNTTAAEPNETEVASEIFAGLPSRPATQEQGSSFTASREAASNPYPRGVDEFLGALARESWVAPDDSLALSLVTDTGGQPSPELDWGMAVELLDNTAEAMFPSGK